MPSIKRMVNDYLPTDAPASLRQALFDLTVTAHGIAAKNNFCPICLTFMLADMLEEMSGKGMIAHEPDGEDDAPERTPAGSTIQ